MYPITTATAVAIGLWLVILSFRVIGARRSEGISDGDAGNIKLSRRMRAQGNLSEYAPIALVLLFLAESQGGAFWLNTILAASLVIGRLMHGVAFSFTSSWPIGRVGGMIMTFTALVGLALVNLWILLV